MKFWLSMGRDENLTIIWICPSICPFRIYSAVSGRIAAKLFVKILSMDHHKYYKPIISLHTWESGWKPHWQGASNEKLEFGMILSTYKMSHEKYSSECHRLLFIHYVVLEKWGDNRFGSIHLCVYLFLCLSSPWNCLTNDLVLIKWWELKYLMANDTHRQTLPKLLPPPLTQKVKYWQGGHGTEGTSNLRRFHCIRLIHIHSLYS